MFWRDKLSIQWGMRKEENHLICESNLTNRLNRSAENENTLKCCYIAKIGKYENAGWLKFHFVVGVGYKELK